ncbi:hypothetical protein BU604_10900 [Staphylococcus arlettae]|uniref:hypothetical protein n=1 Tax=Staphylococcus arlettae TaxID=29378 RepID=UPI000E68D3CA|nr:hypothetical protein [Staphylococcus arlettae]RIM58348.1 hypothetical protein BU604_10900 [Staphylococcus arlettae]
METIYDNTKNFVDYMASKFPPPLEVFRNELHEEDLERVHPGLAQKLVKEEIFERTRTGMETEEENEIELNKQLHSDDKIPKDFYEITIWNEDAPKQMMCEFIDKFNIELDENEIANFVFNHDNEVMEFRLKDLDKLDIYIDLEDF